MRNRDGRRPFRGVFHFYVGAVLALGTAGWTVAVASVPGREVWSDPILWLLGGLLLVAQFRSVVYRGENGRTDFGFTVPFSLAVFVLYGPVVAILIDGGTQALSEVLRRKPVVKILFNASMTAVAFWLLAMAFKVAGVPASLPAGPGPAYLLVFTAGAILTLVFVHLTVTLAIGLSQGLAPRNWIDLRELFGQTASSGLLVPLALLLASAADSSVWLVPIAAVPVLMAEVVSVDVNRRQYEASHDTDTGLLNRRGLVERLSKTPPERYSLAYVQLSGLDELSEGLSPDRVDELRRQVADRLSDRLDAEATIARAGDDALAVVLPGDAPGIEDALARWLAEPFRLDSWHLAIEVAIGVARAPDHGRDPGELLKRAKAAAYSAIRQELHATVYCSGIEDEHQARLSLMADLRRALQEDELTLYYQPRMCLVSGRPLGVEALVRWEHPRRGLVPPDEFIPPIEQTLLIDDLTRWVLDRAARQLAEWRGGGLDLTVAVNIATHNLLDRAFVDEVAAALDLAGVPPGAVELELTERSVAADVDRTRDALGDLSDLGVRLSLDDFGTGYSSMAQLRTMPVHMVKIDRSFVMPLSWESSDRALVAAMVGLASSLGLDIVAEGVETDEARSILTALGCGSAQGYFFCRPLPGVESGDWLRSQLAPQPPVASARLR